MTRVPAGNVKINIYFNSKILEVMRKLATARGTTYSELIREACRGYALKEGPKVVSDTAALKEMTR